MQGAIKKALRDVQESGATSVVGDDTVRITLTRTHAATLFKPMRVKVAAFIKEGKAWAEVDDGILDAAYRPPKSSSSSSQDDEPPERKALRYYTAAKVVADEKRRLKESSRASKKLQRALRSPAFRKPAGEMAAALLLWNERENMHSLHSAVAKTSPQERKKIGRKREKKLSFPPCSHKQSLK